MILICPECATRYRLADGAVGPAGRTVRCKACGHRWHATPESVAVAEATAASTERAAKPAAEAAPPEPVEPAPLPPPIVARPGPHHRASGAVAWLLLVLLVLVLAAFYLGRNQMVEAFPSLAPIYQKIGLRVVVRSGLELRNLSSSRVEQNGRPVLVVTGEIHNTAAQDRALPRVRVALLDDARGEIEFGLFDAADRELAGGGITRFEARMLDPPDDAKTSSVSLAEGL